MSYAKVPKACQDFPVGIEEVNQVASNGAADLDILEVEHGTSGLPDVLHGNDWARKGQHSHVTIPRAVCAAKTGSAPVFLGRTGFVTVETGLRSALGGLSIERLTTGTFVITMAGLTDFWTIQTPAYGSSSDNRLVTTQTYPASPSNVLSVLVRLYDLSGSSPALADFPWTLVVHGPADT